MKKIMSLTILCVYMLTHTAEPKTITFRFEDDQSLELSRNDEPILRQSNMLKELFEVAPDDSEIPLSMKMDTFRIILDIIRPEQKQPLPFLQKYIPQKENTFIIKKLNVLPMTQLAAVTQASDYLDIPGLTQIAIEQLAYRILEHDNLKSFIEDPSYLKHLRLHAITQKELAKILQDIALQTIHVSHTTLAGHIGSPLSLSLSNENQYIATVSQNYVARIWKAKTGALVHTFQGQFELIQYSPDNKFVATVSSHNIVQIWNASDYILQNTIVVNNLLPWTFTYSPDGTLFATASKDKKAQIWTLKGSLLHSLIGHTKVISIIMFSPDGKGMATASDDATVRIWNPVAGTLLHTLSGHKGAIITQAYSNDGTLLATAARDKTVRIWNTESGELLHTLSTESIVNSLAFSPDNTLLATASNDGIARIWDPITGILIRSLTDHTKELRAITYSPNGAFLATASNDETVRVWNPKTGVLLHIFKDHKDAVRKIMYSNDGTLFATASNDGTVRIWNFTELMYAQSQLQKLSLNQLLFLVALYWNRGTIDIGQHPHLQKIFDSLDSTIQTIVKKWLKS